MPKKIKFALEMKDGVKVRTIEDLRDSFDIEKAISYFLDGKLLEWLQDRYYGHDGYRQDHALQTDTGLYRAYGGYARSKW